MENLFFRENILEILNYLDEGIHIVDKNGKIVYYNSSAQGLDGIDSEKAIGRNLLQIYPSLTEETSTLLTAIQTGAPILKKQQTFINYKGEKITTINSSIPIKSRGKILGAIEISNDITNVRQMSEQIIDLQDQLLTNNRTKSPEQTKDNGMFTITDIVGQDPEIVRLKNLALQAAKTNASVLISGDTGTGKELFVHSIHNASIRRNKPFIAQNCAALPATLLEGILFGTTKGGFTGAEDRPGLFELSHGGTLFLDEINSMPLELQSKLLRVLQDGNIRRVGGTNTKNIDLRIIAATNIPPEEAIEKKQLRKDLYYRLNVISFEIPALKDRRSDIPILVDYFINKFNKALGKNFTGISKEVKEIFLNYKWEGNVRELEHLIEGIMSLHDAKTIELEHLPRRLKNKNIGKKEGKFNIPLPKVLEETEKELIEEALILVDNNITHAAVLLGIPRQTLQYKIGKYQLRATNNE